MKADLDKSHVCIEVEAHISGSPLPACPLPRLTEAGVDVVEVDTVSPGQPPVDVLVSEVGEVFVVEVSLISVYHGGTFSEGWTCSLLTQTPLKPELKMSALPRVWAPSRAVTSLSVNPNSEAK